VDRVERLLVDKVLEAARVLVDEVVCVVVLAISDVDAKTLATTILLVDNTAALDDATGGIWTRLANLVDEDFLLEVTLVDDLVDATLLVDAVTRGALLLLLADDLIDFLLDTALVDDFFVVVVAAMVCTNMMMVSNHAVLILGEISYGTMETYFLYGNEVVQTALRAVSDCRDFGFRWLRIRRRWNLRKEPALRNVCQLLLAKF